MIGPVRRLALARPILSGWLASVAFWLVSLIAMIRVQGVDERVLYDEWFYWTLSHDITDRFLLTGYTNQLRGVSFPWVISWISSGFGLVEPGPRGTAAVISLVCLPLLAAVIAPSLATSLSASSRRPGLGRILLLNVGLLLFWRNDTWRLLSDIPSLTAFAGAMAVLAWVSRRPVSLDLGRLVAVAGAGVLVAVAANTRPAYLVVAGVAVLLIPLLRWGSSLRSTALVLGVVVLGAVVGFAPQVTVNRHQGVGWAVLPADSAGLVRLQLSDGLRYQRYDTYIGPPSGYPVPSMAYDNTANLGGIVPAEATSMGAYLRLAASHPIPAGETLLRHAFNGLDIRQPGTYVDDVRAPTRPVQILNFTIIVLALAILGIRLVRAWRTWRALRDEVGRGSWIDRGVPVRLWFGAVLAVATGQVLVSAVETRFFLPMHVFLLGVVTLTARHDDLPRRTATRVAVAVGGAALVAASLAFSASVDRSLTPPIPPDPATAAPTPR